MALLDIRQLVEGPKPPSKGGSMVELTTYLKRKGLISDEQFNEVVAVTGIPLMALPEISEDVLKPGKFAQAATVQKAVYVKPDATDDEEEKSKGWVRRMWEWLKMPHVSAHRKDKVSYLKFKYLMMLDWDYTSVQHSYGTIDTLRDAVVALMVFCKKHPDYRFVVYQTPGGVRAFCVSHPIAAGVTAANIMKELKCDPRYTEHMLKQWCYYCRVSPKRGRMNDYVAKYQGKVGTGKVNEKLMQLVHLHDRLCMKKGR